MFGLVCECKKREWQRIVISSNSGFLLFYQPRFDECKSRKLLNLEEVFCPLQHYVQYITWIIKKLFPLNYKMFYILFIFLLLLWCGNIYLFRGPSFKLYFSLKCTLQHTFEEITLVISFTKHC